MAAQCCRCAEQLCPAQFSMIDSVDHCSRERFTLQSAHAFFGQMTVQRRPAAETKFAELEQFFAHGRYIGGLCFKRFYEGNGCGVWYLLWILCVDFFDMDCVI